MEKRGLESQGFEVVRNGHRFSSRGWLVNAVCEPRIPNHPTGGI